MTDCLLIRADANSRIGAGHVMRCLALAQAWQAAGGHVVFATAPHAPAIERRLEAEGMEVVHVTATPGSLDDAAQTAELARNRKTRWVVVDGYHFDADFQHTVKEGGSRLLFVDDNGHAEFYRADAVLNQNLHAHETLYAQREPQTRLLLGPRYALLRREFLDAARVRKETRDVVRNVLVTLGGGDYDNVTHKVIEALRRGAVPDLQVRIVIGPANPHAQSLRRAIGSAYRTMSLVMDAPDMPALMAWADVAVSAGGSTCLELAVMGLPSVVLVVAKNQELATGRLHDIGAARICRGSVEAITEAVGELSANKRARSAMATTGRDLIDGRGAERVARLLGRESINCARDPKSYARG